MIFQRISVATSAPIGEPGPLPFLIAGWASNRELLADLSVLDLDPSLDLDDAGFWPVEIAEPPAFNPAAETFSEGELVADAVNKRFVRQWAIVALPLETRKAGLLDAVRVAIESRLAAGAPMLIGETVLHVDLGDGSRADMGGMATTALASQVSNGIVPWPDSYQIGWITIENVRIPLPTPADGLALAAAVGNRYAQIRQNGRDLKDTIIAAEDPAALDLIDLESGWPA